MPRIESSRNIGGAKVSRHGGTMPCGGALVKKKSPRQAVRGLTRKKARAIKGVVQIW